ncbi:MAG: hypothetical protein QM757_20455 [Paludibaculum sp.]
MGCTVRRLGLRLLELRQVGPAGWGGLDGGLDPAEPYLDPAGIAVEGLDEAVLAEHPFAGDLLVAAAVFQTRVEEGSFPAGMQGEMALEHVPVDAEGSQGWIGHVLGAGLGDGAEVGFEARRHAVVLAVGSGAARVAGDFGLASSGARAGGFPGVGPVGGEPAFGDVRQGHGAGPCSSPLLVPVRVFPGTHWTC